MKHKLEENHHIVQITYADKSNVFAPFVDGQLQGLVLGNDLWFGQTNLSLIATFTQGKLVGPVWKLFEENGFLVSDNLDFSGQLLYIYPGISTLQCFFSQTIQNNFC